LNITLETPFPKLSYEDVLRDYGTDRPDIRFDMKLKDLSFLFKETSFKVFRSTLESGGVIKGLKAPASFSRKELDDLTKFAQELGAKGLAWIKYNKNAGSFEEKFSSPIVKFFDRSVLEKLESMFNPLEDVATFFFVADKEEVANAVLSELRVHLAKSLKLIPENKFSFVWIIDFPLFEWDEEENRLVSVHHPFTHPKEEDIPLLDTNPLKVRSRAYDIVLNGVEIGGGSIRIHKRELQEKIFALLNISPDEAQEKFGFLLTALEYGAPPHGGIAFGLDRLIMLMLGKKSIREVIPFPKTQRAQCLLTGAPAEVRIEQILELHLLPGWEKKKEKS